jgi:hypothetical protein
MNATPAADACPIKPMLRLIVALGNERFPAGMAGSGGRREPNPRPFAIGELYSGGF